MLWTLLQKEIHESITNLRFMFVTLLCLILIPLGFYISMNDYKQRLNDYHQNMQLYEERADNQNTRSSFKAEGYRPPSPFSVFADGLEKYMPNKAITHNFTNINNADSEFDWHRSDIE